MKIAVTGSTGFVGSHLCQALEADGHEVVAIKRGDIVRGEDATAERMSGCQAVVNLAGETISRRWTKAYKRRIFDSRVALTQTLIKAMAKSERPPELLISTSAIGAFAPHGCYNEADESNATDFLGELSRQWEMAAGEATTLGVRTLIFRFALVLGPDGGLLKQLLLPFRLGLGGPVGNGRQHFSWVHIDDLVNAYRFALNYPQMSGVYHICSPNPTTNRDLSKQLGAVLRRPALLPVPAFVLKLVYGEGGEVMTSGQCVTSTRLEAEGYRFEYPHLRQALEHILQKSP